jgi:hypothetical protein
MVFSSAIFPLTMGFGPLTLAKIQVAVAALREATEKWNAVKRGRDEDKSDDGQLRLPQPAPPLAQGVRGHFAYPGTN